MISKDRVCSNDEDVKEKNRNGTNREALNVNKDSTNRKSELWENNFI